MTTTESIEGEAPYQDGRPATEALVRVEGATRRFGDSIVLSEVSLDVSAGQIFGLVGPSGSGKTTLVKLLVGLLEPSAGTVLVGGVPPARFGVKERRLIGYVPQEFSLYPSLTVAENARFMAGLYGLGWSKRRGRIKEILSFLEIWDVRKRLSQDLSGGMKRRLSLAGALLSEPQILIVDEPTAGLDPALRIRIWELLHGIRDRGTTIFITTQYIEEAERCDSVAVLSRGKLAAIGSPTQLRDLARLPDVVDVEAEGLTPEIVESLWRIPSVHGVDWDRAARISIRAPQALEAQREIESSLTRQGCTVVRIQGREVTFEEVFMRLTAST